MNAPVRQGRLGSARRLETAKKRDAVTPVFTGHDYFFVHVKTSAALTKRRFDLETIRCGFCPDPLFRRS
jgi:hypothetical protein